MRLTERILGVTLLGSEWVLWLLIGLSLLSVTIMVERGIFLAAGQVDFESLGKELLSFLKEGDAAGARRALAGQRAPESKIASAGLEQYDRGAEAMEPHPSRGKNVAHEIHGLLEGLGASSILGDGFQRGEDLAMTVLLVFEPALILLDQSGDHRDLVS